MQLSVLISIASVLIAGSTAAPVNQTPLKLDFSVQKTIRKPNTSNANYFKHVALKSGVLLELENEYSMYIADIELGTPAQKVRVDVDTGSSDLWVPGAGTKSDYGTYDHTKSSTYKTVSNDFQIGYGDGSQASGDWATDTITLGGATVKKFQFGDATSQTAGEGVFGIGLTGNEAASKKYNNFPIELKNQGFINKVGYSLYLNSVEAKAGSVLFGAIDHAKYTGDLTSLDLVAIDDSGSKTQSPVAFFVPLDSVSAGSNKLATKSYPALLDSGTTLFYAPNDVATAIGEKYGTYSSQLGGYAAACDAKGDDFEFNFGSTSVKVPFSDLLFKADDAGKQCIIGVLGSGSEYYILGDVFLRSSYIYYDLEGNKVSIGQVKYTEESNVELVN